MWWHDIHWYILHHLKSTHLPFPSSGTGRSPWSFPKFLRSQTALPKALWLRDGNACQIQVDGDDQENSHLSNRSMSPLQDIQFDMSQLEGVDPSHPPSAVAQSLGFRLWKKTKETCECKLLHPSIQKHPVPARWFHLPNQEHPRQSAPRQFVFAK